MPQHQTTESDDSGTIEYRFRSIDSSGQVQLKERTVFCKVTVPRGSWEHEIPLDIVAPFPTRFASTPGVVLLLLGIALFAMLFGILSLVDREMDMMNAPTAMATIIVSLLLILYAWRNRHVVWIVFPTNCQNYHIQFCNRGPDAANCEQFVNTIVERVKRARGYTDDEQSIQPKPTAQSN